MTRKDFQDVANIIRNSDLNEEQKSKLALDFALFFKDKNSRFDVSRFVNAVVES